MKKRAYEMRVIDDKTGQRARIYNVNGKECILVKFHASCTGCYESIEGYSPPGAEFHPKHGIPLGMGCRECQGRGFVVQKHYVPVDGNYE